MTIGKRIIAGFAAPLLILLVVAGATTWTTYRLIDTAYWVTHGHQVLENLETLMATLTDAESSQRGYLLTDKDSYLEPYQVGRDAWEPIFNRIQTLTSDNRDQQRRLDEIRPIIVSRMATLDKGLELRKKQEKGPLGTDAALELMKTDVGKKDMDRIRDLIKEMENADNGERPLLVRRDADAKATSLISYLVISVGAAVAFLAVVLIALYVVRSVTQPIRSAIGLLTTSSAKILTATTQQASGAREQAAAVTETVATVDEVTQTSEQATQRAKSLGDAVQRALQVGQAGRKVVEDSIAALAKVQDQVETTAENILALAEQAQAISDITAAVADVAEQTNLLALNAAIEASRAGEHGKGFAVVASEVKALADQSKKATAQVRQILGEIQKGTNAAVLSTEEVTKGVVSAGKVADQAGQTIKALAETLAEASQAASQIMASAGQQATGMGQIHQAMRSIDEAARQNLASLGQAEQAAQNLDILGGQFTKFIG